MKTYYHTLILLSLCCLIACSDTIDTEAILVDKEEVSTNTRSIFIETIGELKYLETVNVDGETEIKFYDDQSEKALLEFHESNPNPVLYLKSSGETILAINNSSALLPEEIVLNENAGVDQAFPRTTSAELTFFDDDGYRDRELSYAMAVGQTIIAVPNLKTVYSTNPVKRGFNDKCSSVILRQMGPGNFGYRLEMFDDTNYDDRSVIIEVNNWQRDRFVPWLGNPWLITGGKHFNDKMSSFRLQRM